MQQRGNNGGSSSAKTPNSPTATKPDDMAHIKDPDHAKKVDYVELIAFCLVALAQISLLIVMISMNFRMFSIIYFFTAPMWMLFAQALVLFVVRISKYTMAIPPRFLRL